MPPVCVLLSSSTLIGLRIYLDEFARQLELHKPTSTTARTSRKPGRFFIAWLEQGGPHTSVASIGPAGKAIARM